MRQSQNVDEVQPVCSSEKVPEHPLFPEENELSKPVDFVEVTQILGCTKPETKHIDFSLDGNGNQDTPVGGDGSDAKSPKRVESAADLGDANFQVRSLILGTVPTGLADRIVELPSLKQAHTDNPLSALEPLGKLSFAQAEYYYDGSESRDQWMWNMKWRARLRRFRLPDKAQIQEFKTFLGPIVPDAVERLPDVENLAVH